MLTEIYAVMLMKSCVCKKEERERERETMVCSWLPHLCEERVCVCSVVVFTRDRECTNLQYECLVVRPQKV